MERPEISYTTMHGAGNSFVILENPDHKLRGEELGVLAPRLCSKLGTDGMIVLSPADDADMSMAFYNRDGSVGEMCGNGARCVARYGVEHGLVKDAQDIRIRTMAGPVQGRRISDTLYEIRLNDPGVIKLEYEAAIEGESVPCSYIELGSPGIPHAVVEVSESAFENMDALRQRGRALRYSSSFPKGANVSFVSVLDSGSVRAATYERGVEDFTLACGTGCGAIALSLVLRGRVDGEHVEIQMPGGLLAVTVDRRGGQIRNIFLTGPTAVTAEGKMEI